MIIMIDHYDSFSHMIKDYIAQLGYNILMIQTDQVDLARIEAYQPTHIILGPGPGHPQDPSVAIMHKVIQKFLSTCPILGICLGHQVIAEYFGGKVIHALQIVHGKLSKITHNKDPIFKSVPSSFRVTRYHSLIIDPTSLPEKLTTIAYSKNNNSIEIMGLKHDQYPIWGIQFHPEAALTEHGKTILANFLNHKGCD